MYKIDVKWEGQETMDQSEFFDTEKEMREFIKVNNWDDGSKYYISKCRWELVEERSEVMYSAIILDGEEIVDKTVNFESIEDAKEQLRKDLEVWRDKKDVVGYAEEYRRHYFYGGGSR